MGVDHDENIQFRQPGLLFMWKKDQFDPGSEVKAFRFEGTPWQQ